MPLCFLNLSPLLCAIASANEQWKVMIIISLYDNNLAPAVINLHFPECEGSILLHTCVVRRASTWRHAYMTTRICTPHSVCSVVRGDVWPRVRAATRHSQQFIREVNEFTARGSTRLHENQHPLRAHRRVLTRVRRVSYYFHLLEPGFGRRRGQLGLANDGVPFFLPWAAVSRTPAAAHQR